MSGTGTSSSSHVSLSPSGRDPPLGASEAPPGRAQGLRTEGGGGGARGFLSRPETPPGTHIVSVDHVASGSGVTALQG